MPENINELPEGGMGIKIMSHIADELSYTRTPERQNCLMIVKNYEQQCLDESQLQQRYNTPLQQIRLQVNTDLNALNQVLDWYEQLETLPISKKVLEECKLAIAEGFTNAVRHAHKNLPVETPIELEVTVFDESMEIKIWDYGQPFDLEAKINSFLWESGDSHEEGGGRCIKLIPKIANSVSYTRTSDERNCLLIVKNFKSR